MSKARLGTSRDAFPNERTQDASEKPLGDWFESGELTIVRPETHPEAFVPVAPDGGWSWVVLFASVSCGTIIDGIGITIGLILMDMTESLNASKTQLALIGSTFHGAYQIGGPIVAALINSFGCRATALGGALLASTTLFISAFITSATAMLITFGLIGGFSFGLIHLPSMISVNLYFNRIRALANGIAVIGSPLGACIFGPLTNALLRHYNWSNTLIMFSALLLHCVAFACLYRPLRPAVTLKQIHVDQITDGPEGIEVLLEDTEEADSYYHSSSQSVAYNPSVVSSPMLGIASSQGRFGKPLLKVDESCELDQLDTDLKLMVKHPTVHQRGKHDDNYSIESSNHHGEKDAHSLRSQFGSMRSVLSAPNMLSKSGLSMCNSGVNMELSPSGRGNSIAAKATPVTSALRHIKFNFDNVELGDDKRPSQSLRRSSSHENVSSELHGHDRNRIPTLMRVDWSRRKSSRNANFNMDVDMETKRGSCKGSSNHSNAAGTLVTPNRRNGSIKFSKWRIPKLPTSVTPTTSTNGSLNWIKSSGSFQTAHVIDETGQSLLPSDSKADVRVRYTPVLRLENFKQRTRAGKPTSACIVSTPCLSIERGKMDTFQATQENKHARDKPARLWEQPIDETTQLTSELDTPHINSTTPTSAIYSNECCVIAPRIRGIPKRMYDFSSSVTVAAMGKECLSPTRTGRPMINSFSVKSATAGPIHMSTFSGLSDVTCKLELVSLDEKPAILLLPDYSVSLQDYRRPFYRSDIFYEGNVDPSKCIAGSNPAVNLDPGPLKDSPWFTKSALQFRVPGSGVASLRDSSIPYSTDTNIAPKFHNYTHSAFELAALRSGGCYESFIVSLTKVPIPEPSQINTSLQEQRLSLEILLNCLHCVTQHLTLPIRACIKCLRRLRDCRIPICGGTDEIDYDPESKHFLEEVGIDDVTEDVEASTRPNKVCCKSFTDVLRMMTNIRLLNNKPYLLAVVANFCGTLGLLVPVIYVSDLASHNGIPENLAFYFISVMGLVSIIARLSIAGLSSLTVLRPIPVQALAQLLLGLVTAILPLLTTFPTHLMAFAMIGLLIAPLASLNIPTLCELVELEDLTTAVGLITLSRGLSTVMGAPIAALLCEKTGGFLLSYIAAGASIAVSGVLFGGILLLPRNPTKKLITSDVDP